jgi:hypothetical protein
LPVGIYLKNNNTLSLKNAQPVYPNATTVKRILPNQIDPHTYVYLYFDAFIDIHL